MYKVSMVVLQVTSSRLAKFSLSPGNPVHMPANFHLESCSGKSIPCVKTTEGMRAMVITNISTESNLANGMRGVVEKVVLDPHEPAEGPMDPDTGARILRYPPALVLFRADSDEEDVPISRISPRANAYCRIDTGFLNHGRICQETMDSQAASAGADTCSRTTRHRVRSWAMFLSIWNLLESIPTAGTGAKLPEVVGTRYESMMGISKNHVYFEPWTAGLGLTSFPGIVFVVTCGFHADDGHFQDPHFEPWTAGIGLM
ncbi:hypothetical protein C8J57DRAFT_1239235 [Mycena rebaudengoi]|nr:hypothetical protein C8J57DRAFT_1239235 [Mycena rebaudengoi]